MSRQQLLNLAAERPAINKTALEMARKFNSPETVARAFKEVQQTVARFECWGPRVLTASIVSLLVAVSILVVLTVTTRHESVPGIVLAWVFGFVSLFMVLFVTGCCVLELGTRRYKREVVRRDMLQLIAGTDACQQALGYVEKNYPSVIAWRDMAIAERQALSGFDVEILRCLHDRAERDLSHAELQKVNEEACRKLHGVLPLSVSTN